MEEDDPWDWSIDRVVQELCTDNRTWQSPLTPASRPNPTLLERALREQEVKGCILLLEVDDAVMRYDFGLNVLGHRAFLRAAILTLRLTSTQYKSYTSTARPGNVGSSYGGSGQNELMPQLVASSEQPRPSMLQPSPRMLAVGAPQKSAAHPPQQISSGTVLVGQPAANSDSLFPDASGIKGRDLNAEDASTNPEFESQSEIADHSDSQNDALQGENPGSAPAPALDTCTTTIKNGEGRKRIAPTLITSEIDPNRNRYILTEADFVAKNSPQTTESGVLRINDGKKMKRVTPTLVTSDIDPWQSRELPVEADNVIQNAPETIKPGVPYTLGDGRKRLVPILQSDPGSTKSDQLDTNGNRVPQTQEPNLAIRGQEVPRATVTNSSHKKQPKTYPVPLATGYLGKQKMCVDDIFYHDIAVGEDLPILSDDREFNQGFTDISNGRRIYVHNIMKHFLRSEPQDFIRDKRPLSAVIPYSTKLAPRFQKPSFTLFHATPDGKMHATRAEVPSWPEIDPESSVEQKQKVGDENVARFDLPGPEIFNNLGSYDGWDPSQLEKYRLLEGADDVLPLYGDSDSENEYDEALWREIEDERGSRLLKPIRTLRKEPLSDADVHTAIDNGISELVAKWKLKKLPKLQLKAYKMWQKSRKFRTWRRNIEAAQEKFDHMTQRLTKMREEILRDMWTSTAQVLRQTTIMEQTVSDREVSRWKISLLEGKKSPEKPPQSLLVSKPVKKTRQTERIKGESIESDTDATSSDDSLDDFIVSDDPLTSQEELELNLADVERSDGDSTISDTSSPEGLEVLFRPVKAGTVRNDTEMILGLPGSSAPFVKRERSFPKDSATSGANPPEVVDLTHLSSDDGPSVINLGTPKKKGKRPLVTLIHRNSTLPSPVAISDGDDTGLENGTRSLSLLTNPASIAKHSTRVWETRIDRKSLLTSVLYNMGRPSRDHIFEFISAVSEDDLWSILEEVMNAYESSKPRVKGMDKSTLNTITIFIRLFQTFIDCKTCPYREPPSKTVIEKLKAHKAEWFTPFYELCYQISNSFDRNSVLPQHSKSRAEKRRRAGGANNESTSIDSDDETEDEEDGEPLGAVRRRRPAGTTTSGDEGETPDETPNKKRRKVFEDAHARDLREQDRKRLAEQEERRMKLQASLARSGHARDEEHGRIIINDAKADDQGYILVHSQIAPRIKKHQIDGLRFMWNQIVAGENTGQGCLLAHTMGLGKTMQVITLLVAIAQASRSSDSTVASQVPERLRQSKTMVLCPPGLIDNWMDELLTWAPPNLLGRLLKVNSSVKQEDRLSTINTWYADGGVLVIGYEMFRGLVNVKKTPSKRSTLSDEQQEEVSRQLLEGPNIIIADEAHKLKNAKATLAMAASQFKSNSRVALTGSPLANNVEEYHTMIDWVAPNYLGPIREFRAKYAHPIQMGLWQDSASFERRISLKMLGVLKEDIAPKVHRADMAVLRNDLPPKKEFVITVPLTELQRKAYSLYVQSMQSAAGHSRTKDGEVTQTTLWHWLTVLSLLCNHPDCFRTKLYERKEDAKETPGADVPIVSESGDLEEAIANSLNEPIWKVGVSQELINAETDLFREEAMDIRTPNLSNKVRILCQILDATRDVGDKVLVFSQSIPTLNFLEDLCKSQGRSYSRLDGKTTMNKRQGQTKAFNTGNAELYLISTAAGGLGLNLPGANRVVIFDFKFNPIMEEQAIGRAYRIGQKRPTFIYRFIAGGTFEDTVHNKTVFKMQLASRVVDKKNPIAYAKRKISDFLFEPREVEQKDLSEFVGMDPHVLDKLLSSQNDTKSIRAIVQSDTFERDDDDKLTAEEEKEVRRLLSDEQLKRSDPDAWHKKQASAYSTRTYQMPTVQGSSTYNGPVPGYQPHQHGVSQISAPSPTSHATSLVNNSHAQAHANNMGVPLQTNTAPPAPTFYTASATPTAAVTNKTALLSNNAASASVFASAPPNITSTASYGQSPIMGANTTARSLTPETPTSPKNELGPKQPTNDIIQSNGNQSKGSEGDKTRVCYPPIPQLQIISFMRPEEIQSLVLTWGPNSEFMEPRRPSGGDSMDGVAAMSAPPVYSNPAPGPIRRYYFPIDFSRISNNNLQQHLKSYGMDDGGARQELLERCHLLEKRIAWTMVQRYNARTVGYKPIEWISLEAAVRVVPPDESHLRASREDHPMPDAGIPPSLPTASSEDHHMSDSSLLPSRLTTSTEDHHMSDSSIPPLFLTVSSEDLPMTASSSSTLPSTSSDNEAENKSSS